MSPHIVEGTDLRKLVADQFPEAIKTKDGQTAMYQFMREFGTQDGMTFNGFLWITRRWHDNRDELDIVVEDEVVEDCGYSAEEVEGFRQLFSSDVDFTGELSFEKLTGLLQLVLHSMKDSEVDSLHKLVKSMTPLQKDSVRFPQFLRLMKLMCSQNFFSVNESVDLALQRDEKERQTRPSLKRHSASGYLDDSMAPLGR